MRREILSAKINAIALRAHTAKEFSFASDGDAFYDYRTIIGDNGPLWTREFEPRFYAKSMSEETVREVLCERVEATLQAMNVTRMVIGHNVQSDRRPTQRCDGKLYSIDVGISCAYGCNVGAIVIDVESDLVSLVA